MSDSSASGSRTPWSWWNGTVALKPSPRIGQRPFGQLHADVLDRVRGDFGADQFFHHVEQPLIGQQSEHGRASPHGRIVANAALREGDVEVPGDVLPALFGNGHEPLLEGEVFQR